MCKQNLILIHHTIFDEYMDQCFHEALFNRIPFTFLTEKDAWIISNARKTVNA